MEIITTHTNTDLDGLAAAVAAQKLYPGAALVFPGKLSKNVEEFLALHKDILNIKSIKNVNLEQVEKLIIVDTKNSRRLGKLGELAGRDGVEMHIYDHHPRAEDDLRGTVEMVESVGATVTLLVEKIQEQKLKITSLEATMMIMGIYGDTGSLLFTSTTSRDLRAASFLLEQGAKLSVVADFLGRPLTGEQKSLFKELVMSARHYTVNGIKILLARAQVDEFVVGLAPLTHTLSEIESPDAVFTVVEMEDRVYIVGRSNVAQVKTNQILARFGGGGHAAAAAATIKNAAVDKVMEELKEIIHREVSSPLRVKDIMSTPVKTVFSPTTIAEANQVMLRYGHTGLPVVDEGKLVGVISRRDVEKANHHGLGHAPVKGFMTVNVVSVHADVPVSEVQDMMIEHDIGRLPVEENGKLVGIVSRTDLLRTLHGEVQQKHRIVYDDTGEVSYYKNIRDLMRSSLLPSVWSVLKQAGRIADNLGYKVYAAGGVVRDIMLGADSLDVDLVVEGDGITLARALASAYDARVRAHEKFGTADIEFSDGLNIDIATARLEFYEYPAALPQVESSSLRQDLYRRDFTINAMAVSLNEGNFGELVDYFGGREDLQYGLTGLIRVLHNVSFIEDPTRILRAVRFEQRYHMDIEPQTLKLLQEAVHQGVLNRVSDSRLWDEIQYILREQKAGPMLARLHELEIWPFVLPGVSFEEIAPVLERLENSLSLMGQWGVRQSREKWFVYFIAVLHRSPRDKCLEICNKYNLSKRHTEKVLAAAQHWENAFKTIVSSNGETPTSRLARPVLALPMEAYPVLLSMLEEEGSREILHRLLKALHRSRPAVSGKYIKSLGVPPGPVYRQALEALWRARLDGEVTTEEEEKIFICNYLSEVEGENLNNV